MKAWKSIPPPIRKLGWNQSGMFAPDIVLLDMVMPGVAGMEVLEKILEFDPRINVILMTGFY